MQSKYQTAFAISLLIIIVDLATKSQIHSDFAVSESVTVIPNILNLTYIRNPGAAFGFLAQSPEIFRKVFFTVLPLIACTMIFRWLQKVSIQDRSQILAFSMILGGAFGNYLNRMYLGYVVDFLDFHLFYKYHWPAFNIADIAIVCGVGILGIGMLSRENARNQIQLANGKVES